MDEPCDDQELINLWREGDQEAARQIYDRYIEKLLPLARRRLGRRIIGRIDAEDVLQSVFRTFFQRARAGHFQVEDEHDLCKLLVRITVHKTLRRIAAETAAKRDPHREIGGAESQDRLVELLGREPTPDEAIEFLDQLEHLLRELRPQEREILQLRLQGCTNEEVAKKLGTYDRSIRRTMERIRGLAQQDGFVD
jgi:RNA polymerase sigma-70 factor, ECF subfamily